MSGECREDALEGECKLWKPKASECCPLCDAKLYVSSIIPMNGQVNFGCSTDRCPITGFIHKGKIYFSDDT